MANPTRELHNFFPNETGRVNGYAVGRATKAISAILENGTNVRVDLVDSTDIALMPDQIEDYAFYRGLQRHDAAKGVHDFARVLVQSGLLEEEGVTLG